MPTTFDTRPNGQHTVLAITTVVIAKACVAGAALAKLVEPGPYVLFGGYLALAFSCSTLSAVVWLSRWPSSYRRSARDSVIETRITNRSA